MFLSIVWAAHSSIPSLQDIKKNHVIIANFSQIVPAKEFGKSVNIWQRYGQKFGGMFFYSWLGTTVFRGKFFQILRTSLPNSMAHLGKFSTYSD